VELIVTDATSNEGRSGLTLTQLLILAMACIGFAFDTYALLVMPLIARPALGDLLGVDRFTEEGTNAILNWTAAITWSSAICGGVFGLLGGWLTDRFGRRTVLTYSILLYAVSALLSGFSTSAAMLLVLRCTTFIGVCVEFVAGVAWLAELFPAPKKREAVLGYTQAFSSVGGLLVTGTYILINQITPHLPAILGEHSTWRYTLISGVIPAIPLVIIRPFLPESPVWLEKRAAGTLRRPSLSELFQPMFRRTSLVTAALFACGFAAAFGALQLTPQMVPGLFPEIGKEIANRTAYGASASPEKLAKLKARVEQAAKKAEDRPNDANLKADAARLKRQYDLADPLSEDPSKRAEVYEKIVSASKEMEDRVGSVQFFQEIGGLFGRFALAFLALRIVSRRRLLWLFLLPGLIVFPLVYLGPAAGKLPQYNVELLKAGVFVAGFLTIAQFSYWGNYLPRVYPVHLRGTGESFAANVGGRMVGTSGQLIAALLAPVMLVLMPSLGQFGKIAYAAAATAFLVYALATALTFLLPEPKEQAPQD
jgi:MFS family permease